MVMGMVRVRVKGIAKVTVRVKARDMVMGMVRVRVKGIAKVTVGE
jgi:hypothetical protein